MVNNADDRKYNKLIQRLAQDLNHDELITKIAEERLPQEIKQADKNSSEYVNAIAELKNEIKLALDSVINDSGMIHKLRMLTPVETLTFRRTEGFLPMPRCVDERLSTAFTAA